MKDYSLAGNFQPERFNEEFLAKLGRVFTPDVQSAILNMHWGSEPVGVVGVPNYKMKPRYLALTGKAQVKTPEPVGPVYDWQAKDVI